MASEAAEMPRVRTRTRVKQPNYADESDEYDENSEKRQKTASDTYTRKTILQPSTEYQDGEDATLSTRSTPEAPRPIATPRKPRASTASGKKGSQKAPKSNSSIRKYFESNPANPATPSVSTSASVTQLGTTETSTPAPRRAAQKSSTQQKRPRKPTVRKALVKQEEYALGSEKVPGTVDTRPLPIGRPPVWSRSRQWMCEALPWYKSHQGGAYTNGGYCRGFLVDGNGGTRSYMDSQIIITRAGGGCKNENGVPTQVNDHSIDSSQVQCLIRNMVNRVPVGVIVGNSNTSCPVQIPHDYCVLGWFLVTKVWPEKDHTTGKTIFKYRFQKLDIEEESWWSPMPTETKTEATGPRIEEVTPITNPDDAPSPRCDACDTVHTQIYEQGWTCLSAHCSEFHKVVDLDDGIMPTYRQEFLRERTTVGLDVLPYTRLKPSLFSDEGLGEDPLTRYSRAVWRGFVCPHCDGCSPRRYFSFWKCEYCSFKHATKMPILGWAALLDDHAVGIYGHALPADPCEKAFVKLDTRTEGHWRITKYELSPGNFLTHFQANMSINAAPNSANKFLIDMQKEDIGLQRYPREQGTMKGDFLSTNFIKNFGLPYDYDVKTDDTAFKDAPKLILDALQRLSWAGKYAVGDDCKEFNEILAVGYFEEGKMDYHDDGEEELGPTIASLSLGGSARMTVRMKTKYHSGITKCNKEKMDKGVPIYSSYDVRAPVLRGAWMEQKRRDLAARYHDQPKDANLLAELKELYANNGRVPLHGPVLVDLPLAHGDIVIQHGDDLQKCYEHKVASTGKLRFGLTARHIDPNHWTAQGKLHMGEYDKADVFVYDGTESRIL